MANETSQNARAGSQVVIGLLVVAFGVLFLLDNLNIIYLRHVIFFWPLAFVASGLVALFSDGPRSGRITGIVLIAIGVAMTMNRLGYYFISWRTFWPLVMIGLGGLILYRTLGGGRQVSVNRCCSHFFLWDGRSGGGEKQVGRCRFTLQVNWRGCERPRGERSKAYAWPGVRRSTR